MAGKVETIGQDLVAMCVNDLVRVGAKPLFFLDYLATGKIKDDNHYEILRGIYKGCKLAGTSFLGGETAEMPGMYADKHFDLAGTAVGKVRKDKIIDGKKIKQDATILGIESSGLHSNGYSLARKVFFEIMQHEVDDYVEELEQTVASVLLEPTIIYSKPILDLIETFPDQIKGMAHITGGGIPNKLPKTLPERLGAEINRGSWPVHNVFNYIAKNGPVDDEEMNKTFNLGIGMVIVVNNLGVIPNLISRLKEKHNLKSYPIGKVIEGRGIHYI